MSVEKIGPLARLVAELGKLPGIGPRSAERLAFHLLRAPKAEAEALVAAVREVKERLRPCGQCFHVSEADLCEICSDGGRDGSTICVVEQSKDLWAIEKSGAFRGVYHVLVGRVAPLEGIGAEDLTMAALTQRVRAGGVREVILATNPNLEGDGTALHIAKALAGLGARLTRIARGVPSGGSLEFASRAILSDAIQGRQEVK